MIATHQVNEASLTLDTLQLSRGNVNSVVCSYLSPTPVGVGVGTSLIWAVDQLSSLRESGYARLVLGVQAGLQLECAIYRLCCIAVDKAFQQWLCVEQSCELCTDIRGRGGASNVH